MSFQLEVAERLSWFPRYVVCSPTASETSNWLSSVKQRVRRGRCGCFPGGEWLRACPLPLQALGRRRRKESIFSVLSDHVWDCNWLCMYFVWIYVLYLYSVLGYLLKGAFKIQFIIKERCTFWSIIDTESTDIIVRHFVYPTAGYQGSVKGRRERRTQAVIEPL